MKRKFSVTSSFNDLLFNALIGFFILLLLSLALIKPESKKDDIQLKAEYMISMEWPDKSKDDVDLVLVMPNKQIVFYGNKDVKIASLDRDDRGAVNDVIRLDDGTILKVEENWENITIRKNYPGEFIVNIVMFHKKDRSPTPVTVKVEKLNPYKLIFSGKIVLIDPKQQETVIRFTLNRKGKVIRRSQEPFYLQEITDR